jgi:tripartite-type tricarboxylate transporter receptor subunit TctC
MRSRYNRGNEEGGNMKRRCASLAAVLAAAVVGLPLAAQAQSYPAKPVRLVVPFAPGGSLDLLARRMGQKMGESMGQPIKPE